MDRIRVEGHRNEAEQPSRDLAPEFPGAQESRAGPQGLERLRSLAAQLDEADPLIRLGQELNDLLSAARAPGNEPEEAQAVHRLLANAVFLGLMDPG